MPKTKENFTKNLFRGEKKKMQGNPTPVKCASTKGARSKAKQASRHKVVSEKEMCLAIKALLLQNLLNVKMKEHGCITIKFTSTLKTEHRTVVHVI